MNQFEIELLPNGGTAIRKVADVIEWPESWADDYYEKELGLYASFRVGKEFQYSVCLYGPGENNKTGGRWLVDISDGYQSQPLWAAHVGIALAFLREQSAVISASALSELSLLYGEDRAAQHRLEVAQ